VGDAGRNGVDVYKVMLPAPPTPLGGADPREAAGPEQPAPGCAVTAGFSRAEVRASGRRVRFDFATRGGGPVTVDVFRAAKRRKVTPNKLVARFANRRASFTWNGRDRRGRRLGKGEYFVRYRARNDVRRFTLRGRGNGRFRVAPTFHRPDSCGLLRLAKLSAPAFGGRTGRALGIAFRVREAARVTVTVRRGGKVVRRYQARTYQPDAVVRLRLPARGTRRGAHVVTLEAQRGQRRATVRLVSRRL
jgi:hypothetical protein